MHVDLHRGFHPLISHRTPEVYNVKRVRIKETCPFLGPYISLTILFAGKISVIEVQSYLA